MSDYNTILYRHNPIGCPLGKTGIVTETRYNPNMARCGRGNEVLVKLDGDEYSTIFIKEELEKC